MKANKFVFLTLMLGAYIDPIQATEVVSLGFNCRPAQAIVDEGLRYAAYPFDWMRSQHDQVYKALQDSFVHFLGDLQPARGVGVIDYYGLHFMHDFPNQADGSLRADWQEFIPSIQENYLRRIERFKNLLASAKKVYFIRYNFVTKKQEIALRDLLLEKYPQLDFTLVAIGDADAFKQDWCLSRIKNFHYVNKDAQGNADRATWKEIFAKLGLAATSNRSMCWQSECDGTCNRFCEAEL